MEFETTLKEMDVQDRTHCINMLRDCADICTMASQWMSRIILICFMSVEFPLNF